MTNPKIVACIGAGLLGASWAGLFSAHGHEVRLYDPNPDVLDAARARVCEVHADLARIGSGRAGGPAEVRFIDNLEEAVRNADHVQENAPERLEIKQAIYAQVRDVAPGAILASSASSIPPSRLFEGIAGRGRAMVVHPMLPPHLMPVAELVPAPFTDADAVLETRSFLSGLGHEVLLLNAELPGFVLNRLQFAVLGEAFQLVDRGICDPVELDRAFTKALGYRWACMGPLMSSHINAEGGFAGSMAAYGEALRGVMGDLRVLDPWSETLVKRIDAPLRAALPEDAIPRARAAREESVLALRRHLATSTQD